MLLYSHGVNKCTRDVLEVTSNDKSPEHSNGYLYTRTRQVQQ